MSPHAVEVVGRTRERDAVSYWFTQPAVARTHTDLGLPARERSRMSSVPVSVVIPTRDRPAGLARAVHSALEQTLRPLEVIVVIDGECRGQLPEHHRVRVARRAATGGDAGAARNQGATMARGELIAFLDDDDVWYPEKLARQLAVLGSRRRPRRERAERARAGDQSGEQPLHDVGGVGDQAEHRLRAAALAGLALLRDLVD